MRKIITTLLFMICSVSYSAPADTIIADTTKFMIAVQNFGNEHIGEKISIIFDKFRKANIPIRILDYRFTSPFVNSNGISYLKYITISYLTPDEEDWPVLLIYVNETTCESSVFDAKYSPYTGTEEERLKRIQSDFTIKEIKFVVMKDSIQM